jgi:RecB family exonuclease
MTSDPEQTPEHPAGASDPRTFLGWSEPLLPLVARELVRLRSRSGVADLRGDRVVVPGGRAGRRLIELLIDRCDEEGVRLVPPQTVTAGRLPETLYRPTPPLATTLHRRLAWSEALRAARTADLEQVFPHPPEPGDSAGWDAMAEVLTQLETEVGGAGARFGDVAGVARSLGGFNDGPRWDVLARLQRATDGILESAGRVEPGRARLDALGSGAVGVRGTLWLVGTVDLPAMAIRMLDALPEDAIRVLVHAPHQMKDGFTRLGTVAPDWWADRDMDFGSAVIRAAPTPSGEAEWSARILASWGGRYAPDEVAIVTPDPERAPFIARRLAAGGVSTRYAGGVPLAQTGPVQLLAVLQDWLGSRSYAALAQALRHPDLPARGPELSDEYFEALLPLRVRAPKDGDPAASSDGGRSRRAESIRTFNTIRRSVEESLASLPSPEDKPRPLSQVAAAVPGALIQLMDVGTLDRGVRGQRRKLEILDRIQGAADEISAVPESLDVQATGADACRHILALLRNQALPEDPDPAGVELVGWLELHLDDARAALLTGMNEGVVPDSVSAHPFLPDALRTRLGLSSARTRFGRDRYLLEANLACRPDVGITLSRTSPSGDPLLPSRLLLAETDERAAARIVEFLEAPPPALEPAPDVDSPGESGSLAGPRFATPTDPALSFQPPTTLGATDFKRLIQDPYLFVLTRVLGLEAVSDADREMGPLAFGNLAHSVLQAFGESERAQPSTDSAVARERMEEILDQHAGRRFGRDSLPAVRIQLRHLSARLARVADWHASAMADGWRIAGIEVRPEDAEGQPVDVPLPGDAGGIGLRGRIDRVDHHPESGRWRLIDYKTSEDGENPTGTHLKGRGEKRRWEDLQLPLYRLLLPHLPLADGSALPPDPERSTLVEVGYVVLPRDLDRAGWLPAAFTAEDLEEAWDRAAELARELQSGVVRFDRPRMDRALNRNDPLRPVLGLTGLPRDAASVYDDPRSMEGGGP